MARSSITETAEAWASLARQAHATAFAIDSALADKRGADSTNPTIIKDLAFGSIRLQQLSLHAQQLSECLVDSPAEYSEKLHVALDGVLPACTAALNHICDQFHKVKPNMVPLLIDASVPQRYNKALATISKMVIFATQIATLDDPTAQVTKLDHSEAKEIFDNSRAALEIAGPGNILTVPN